MKKKGESGAPGGTRTPDLLVRSRTIKSHKLMNRRHMPVSNPLSIGLQIGLRPQFSFFLSKFTFPVSSFHVSFV